MKFFFLASFLFTFCGVPVHAGGTLRVHPKNHRYFTDDSGRAIYLAGHQWFNDLQHNAWNHHPDHSWEDAVALMQRHGMNYLRSWTIWSVGTEADGGSSPLMPFKRTGPGEASDGKPKFNLHQFDPAYFDRLKEHLRIAQQNNIYISVMLFEVYGFMSRGDFWAGNIFRGANNVNGIDVDVNRDGEGLEFFYSRDPKLVAIQQDYVRHVIDTVNEFDNVFFEIANELGAREWQVAMVQFIQEYERGQPKQHLVYLSPGGRNQFGRWAPMSRSDLLESPADLFAVTRWEPRYRGDPPVQPATKPVFMDMDHIAATDNDGDNDWNNNPATPWKLFLRGYHQCLYDQDYWKPGAHSQQWERTRSSIGATVKLANRVDLANMHPRPELSTTGYCLAHPGNEYLVFSADAVPFTVEGLDASAEYDVSWSDTAGTQVGKSIVVTVSSARHRFRPPQEEVVLYLKPRRQ